MLKKHFLWILYFAFASIMMLSHTSEPLFISQGPYPHGKILVWLTLGVFLVYSLHCHVKENFFKTMSVTGKYYWTKQIGIDLYLGVAIVACLIYLNEGSLLILGVWLLPLIIYANLATLLYLAMNYDSLVAHFV